MHKQKEEPSSNHINHGLWKHRHLLQAQENERITREEDVEADNGLKCVCVCEREERECVCVSLPKYTVGEY